MEIRRSTRNSYHLEASIKDFQISQGEGFTQIRELPKGRLQDGIPSYYDIQNAFSLYLPETEKIFYLLMAPDKKSIKAMNSEGEEIWTASL